MFTFGLADELWGCLLGDWDVCLGERQDTIKPPWNNGSRVLSKGGEKASDKSLLGSFHSRVRADDVEISCFFSSGSILPGLIHTCS